MSYSRDLIANFYARDHGVSATLNQINGGLTNTTRLATGSGQSMGFYEKQLRAIGTTLRYAFAGEVIQRMRIAYQNLEQFQQGIADVAAIGTQQNGLPLLQSQLDGLGRTAIRTSIQTATATADILSSYRGLYSSLQGISPKQIGEIGSLVTMGAKISETDPRTLTGALIGQGEIFNPKGMAQDPSGTMTRAANEFFTVIKRSINMTGDELAKQYGRVGPFARLARITPEQMNALIVMSSRGGGSASMFTRNLGQLLSRLTQPASGQAEKAYERLDLGPRQRANMGGVEVLRKILLAAMKASGVTPLSQQEIERLSATRAGQAQLRQIVARQGQQATTGMGGQLIADIFGGRMQSRQAFSILAPMMGVFDDEVRIQKQNADKLHLIQENFNRWLDQNPLNSMSIAIQGFTTDLVSKANPLFRHLAVWTRSFALHADTGLHDIGTFNRRIDRGVAQFVARHPALNHIPGLHGMAGNIAGGSEGVLASAIALSLVKGWIPGVGKLRGRALQAAEAPMMAEATSAALMGTANGQMAAPLWVVIHPLSWALMPGGKFGSSSTTSTVEKDVEKAVGGWFGAKFIKRVLPKVLRRGGGVAGEAEGAVGGMSRLGRVASFARVGGRFIPIVSTPFSLYAEGRHPIRTFHQLETSSMGFNQRQFNAGLVGHGYSKGGSDYAAFMRGLRGRGLPADRRMPRFIEGQETAFWVGVQERAQRHTNRQLMQAQGRFMSPMALSGLNSLYDKFIASLGLDITIRDSTGKVMHKEKRVGVNTTFWRDGNPPPNYQGQPVTHRHGS